MLICENCELPFDPITCHWRCCHCGYRAHCCEGAPLPAVPGTADDAADAQ